MRDKKNKWVQFGVIKEKNTPEIKDVLKDIKDIENYVEQIGEALNGEKSDKKNNKG